MANRHFAKIADVWKHLVLCEVLDRVRPANYAESHAGSAWYPMTPSAQRSYGVLRFVEEALSSPEVASSRYLRSLLRLKEVEGLARYPGSPALAMLVLGDAASYVFCDLDPGSASSLIGAAEDLHLTDRVDVVEEDGPWAVWARVDQAHDPRSWTIHIDPFDPHAAAGAESPSPIDLARLCAERNATVVYWYGFEEGESSTWALPEVVPALLADATAWCGHLSYPEEDFDSTIVGCGVVVVGELGALSDRLDALGRGVASIYADAPLPSGDVGSVGFASEVVTALGR